LAPPRARDRGNLARVRRTSGVRSAACRRLGGAVTFVAIGAFGACRPPSSPPEDVFRRAEKPVVVSMSVPAVRGGALTMGALSISALTASDAFAPEDLVAAAARAVHPEAGGPAPTTEAPRAGPWGPAPHLAPTSEEPASVELRAQIADRRYGIACGATRVASAYERHARASLSCAIVRADARPGTYWALTLRTRGHEQAVQRLRGILERRSPRGPVAGAAFFTVASSDAAVEQRGDDGKVRDILLPNAYITLRQAGNPVVSVRLRSHGSEPRAWVAVRSLPDEEGDVARVAGGVLAWLPWPEG
jgi:hypothetical protein